MLVTMSQGNNSVVSDILALEYNGVTTYGISKFNNLNITIVSDTSVDPLQNNFCAAFDRFSDTDFYILPASLCNNPNTYNTGQIGFFKSNSSNPFPSNLQVTTHMVDCMNNWADVTYPWIQNSAILNQQKQNLASQFPSRPWLSNTFYNPGPGDYGAVPQHDIADYNYLAQGWIITDGNSIGFVGINFAGQLVPSASDPYVQTFSNVLLNTGLATASTQYWMSDQQIQVADINTGQIAYINWVIPANQTTSNFTQFGICKTFMSGAAATCNNVSFSALIWPDMYPALFYFDGAFRQTSLPLLTQKPTQVGVENQLGVLNVVATFRNQKLQFQTAQSPTPIFVSNYVDNNRGIVYITWYSSLLGGTCAVSTTPLGIIATQMVNVGITAQNTTFQLISPFYSGPLVFNFQCYQNSAQYTVQVAYNINYNTTPEVTNTTWNPITWFPFPSIGTPGLGWVNSVFDQGMSAGSTWLDWFWTILYYIALAVGCFLALWLMIWVMEVLQVWKRAKKAYYIIRYRGKVKFVESPKNRPIVKQQVATGVTRRLGFIRTDN
jgi:hypothetical protein